MEQQSELEQDPLNLDTYNSNLNNIAHCDNLDDDDDEDQTDIGEAPYSPMLRKRIRPPPKCQIKQDHGGFSRGQMPFLSAEEGKQCDKMLTGSKMYSLADKTHYEDMEEEEEEEEDFYDSSVNDPANEMPSSTTTTNGWSYADCSSSEGIPRRKEYNDQNKYHCGYPNCDRAFRFMGSLTLHRKSHLRKPSINIGILRNSWKKPAQKRGHWRQPGSKHFKCRITRCPERFSKMQDLRDHMEAIHGGWTQKSFACSQCGRLYMHVKRLRAHQLVCTTYIGDDSSSFPTTTPQVSSSLTRAEAVQPETFTCPTCSKVYKHLKWLRKHQLTCFGTDDGANDNTSTTTNSNNTSQSNNNNNGVVPAPASTLLVSPLKRKKGGMRKICLKCGKRFKMFWRLSRHERLCAGVVATAVEGDTLTTPEGQSPNVANYLNAKNFRNDKPCSKCGRLYLQDWRQKRHEMFCLRGIAIPAITSSTSSQSSSHANSSNLGKTRQASSSAANSSISKFENQTQPISDDANIAQGTFAIPESAVVTASTSSVTSLRSRSLTTNVPQANGVENLQVAHTHVMAVVKQKGKWTYLIKKTGEAGAEDSIAFVTSAKARNFHSESLIKFFESNKLWKCPSGGL